ncbi:MAG: hypothetical protein JNL61_13665 [Rhizobiaceae bacterium]|nr:hypothetical protein [Rhizobiaceae bacterium]
MFGVGMALFRRQISGLLSKANGNGQVTIPQLPKASPLIEAAEEMVAERLATWRPKELPANAVRGEWQAAIDAELDALAQEEEYPAEYGLLQSWSSLERLARFQASLRARAVGKKHLTMTELVESLGVEPADKALVKQLREIRIKTADGELSVTNTDALRYRDLIVTVLQALRNPPVRQ